MQSHDVECRVTHLHRGDTWYRSVVVECGFRLDPVVPPIPEQIALQRPADCSTVQHMRFDGRVGPEVVDVVSTRCHCGMRVLWGIRVRADQIHRCGSVRRLGEHFA